MRNCLLEFRCSGISPCSSWIDIFFVIAYYWRTCWIVKEHLQFTSLALPSVNLLPTFYHSKSKPAKNIISLAWESAWVGDAKMDSLGIQDGSLFLFRLASFTTMLPWAAIDKNLVLISEWNISCRNTAKMYVYNKICRCVRVECRKQINYFADSASKPWSLQFLYHYKSLGS